MAWPTNGARLRRVYATIKRNTRININAVPFEWQQGRDQDVRHLSANLLAY